MMIALCIYAIGALVAQLLLLQDRWKIRGRFRLGRSDIAGSVFGAAAWPFLALVYVGVLTNIWTVRHLR